MTFVALKSAFFSTDSFRLPKAEQLKKIPKERFFA